MNPLTFQQSSRRPSPDIVQCKPPFASLPLNSADIRVYDCVCYKGREYYIFIDKHKKMYKLTADKSGRYSYLNTAIDLYWQNIMSAKVTTSGWAHIDDPALLATAVTAVQAKAAIQQSIQTAKASREQWHQIAKDKQQIAKEKKDLARASRLST